MSYYTHKSAPHTAPCFFVECVCIHVNALFTLSKATLLKKVILPLLLCVGVIILVVQYYPYISSYRQHSRTTENLLVTKHNLDERSQHTPHTSQLIIPALNLDIPIIQNVDGKRSSTYDLSLQNGVAQLHNSASLDSPVSNTVIFGHSSFFSVSNTTYNAIFATLPQLIAGDEFSIWDTNHSTSYRVTESKQVAANDVQITNPTPARQITLITCWPLGLTLKRWIVVAHPIL